MSCLTKTALLVLLASAVAPAQPAALFNVKQYGAAGDGVALDTSDINAAMSACAAAGGGTVYFPAGTYYSGTVLLKSNVTLWLDSGATLLGSKDLSHYQTAIAGDECYTALVLASGAQHVAVI